MTAVPRTETQSEPEVHATALRILNGAGIPNLVAGAFALRHYTGIFRDTKDLDLFVLKKDITAALKLLARAGYSTRILANHWLAHAKKGDYVVDLIHGFGGWRAPVDRLWFGRAESTFVHGVPAKVAPVEDVIWMKAYVAHRERFDLADVLHLIQATRGRLDWPHLLARFGECWEVLLYYLTLFRFVYPSDQGTIPDWVMHTLLARLDVQLAGPDGASKLCRGTLLDRFSYLQDVRTHGFRDGREEFAVAQGYTPRDIAEDRREAWQMVTKGRVQPARDT